jgi:hypothetical protein
MAGHSIEQWRMIPGGPASSRATRQPMASSGTRFNDRCLLSTVVPLANRQPRQCSAARHAGERPGRRLPALQALQPGRTFKRTPERSLGREGMPDDRGE